MRLLVLSLLSCVALPALAQTPDANTQAILDLLKGINTRLDTMEQRIEKVETQTLAPASTPVPATAAPATSTQAAASAAPPAQASPPPGMVIHPGWLVGALPYTAGNPEPEPLFYFPLDKNPNTFNVHTTAAPSSSWFAYKGEAQFNAYVSGRYNFAITVEPPQAQGFANGVGCVGYFQAGTAKVFTFGQASPKEWNALYVSAEVAHNFSGSVDLQEGNYDLTFLLSCAPRNSRDKAIPRAYYKDSFGPADKLDWAWRNTKFSVQVRTPQDLTLRSFHPKELFYYAPVGVQGAAGPAVPSPGDRKTLTADLNVRRSASTNAPLAAKLTGGDALEIVSVTADQEWVEVAMKGRRLGFVKVTALNANSR